MLCTMVNITVLKIRNGHKSASLDSYFCTNSLSLKE